MPPKGYRHLSVREDVYRRLEEFARSKGLARPVDALLLLLEYADIYSKLEYILQVRVNELLQVGVKEEKDTTSTGNITRISGTNDISTSDDPITRNSGTITHNTGNNPPQQPSPRGERDQKKGDACSWLEERRVIVEGDIADRYDRNTRDRLFRKWKEMCKAEVVEGSSERAAVTPQLWEELQKKINMINSDSNELAKKMLDKDEYRLFRWLRDQGILVFSNIEKRWKIVK